MTELAPHDYDGLVGLADEMIPGRNGWPRPSETGIELFFQRVLGAAPDAARARVALDALADHAGVAMAEADGAQRVAALTALEQQQPRLFRALLEFVYFGYYSRPSVVEALNEVLGTDYISPPQPRGYELSRDEDPVPHGLGGYTPTEQMRPLDLGGLAGHEEAEARVRAGASARQGNSATTFT
ncbi:gluconate 2-dehydrogenase subunit 3 family protein [Patulibacter defluvii]|uniref:gluconate 2-dehydrogenase subunit 3 family protein n=1 Tax=Patulibacter defluvii TaxID=3095358 RepID=UPI002A7641E2|nr:gluconate 2-dehydrogenase subunit 3 family protein [Patulibacter sp. DM4]